MATTTYYEVIGTFNGALDVLFGSFDRQDCKGEIEAERDTWKMDGFKSIRIRERQTEETPSAEVYGDNHYMTAVCNALKGKNINVSVGDVGENGLDVYHSRDIGDIRDNVEATDDPYIVFYSHKQYLGLISICGDDGEIIDYTDNVFVNSIL
jgi:hypothetical protein